MIYCLLFIVAICLVGCGATKTDERELDVYFNIDSFDCLDDSVKLSDLFTEFKLVKLETNDECLINGDGKIVKCDSVYYIQSINEIFKFDNDGKFIGKLASVGDGPQNYIKLYDFDVVARDDTNELWVLSYHDIKVYDADNLNYKYMIDFKEPVSQFKYVNDSTIFVVTPNEVTFKIFNIQGNIRKEFMKKDLANSCRKKAQFFQYNGNLLYQIDNTQEAVIYNIKSDSLYCINLFFIDNVLTREKNEEYCNKYGYFDGVMKVLESNICLSSIKNIEDKIVMSLMGPQRKRAFVLYFDDKTFAYEYDMETSVVYNDIIPTHSLLFLSTIINTESDDGVIMMIYPDLIKKEVGILEDENPYLLDVTNIGL